MSSIQVPFFDCINSSKIHVFKYTQQAPLSHFSNKIITMFWFAETPQIAHFCRLLLHDSAAVKRTLPPIILPVRLK
jgi:hypothetical protein